ncbi:archease [Patescibacteria group bacterium]|nr:archease [Patescibacteria group bacterium]
MKKFEILEHKADLKIRAFGSTKKESFLNMLKGMTDALKPEIKKSGEVEKEIKIQSPDLPALLVDFLSEVLYLGQVNREAYFDINFKKFSDTKMECKIIGRKVEIFGEDIKAVTYHQLEVRQNQDGAWEATVLFDI